MTIQLVPIDLKDARRFVALHHSHCEPTHGWKFGVGVETDEPHRRLVAVAVAEKPRAEALADGRTIEVTRVATDGTRMACSTAYAAICRAAKALGWRRAITYTLESECAACVRAAGFVLDASGCGDPRGFDKGTRHRVETNLWGERLRPDEPKNRWVRQLA